MQLLIKKNNNLQKSTQIEIFEGKGKEKN